MNKMQIEQLLSTQKVNSISDIICFVIEQVNKTISYEPMQEIHLRLLEIEKPKGLDAIMIEEVKTIVEAMLDQRQENIRSDLDMALNDHFQSIQHLISNLNQGSKNARQSLGEIDILNFLNSNSFSGGYQEETKKYGTQEQIRKNRESFNFAFSKELTRDNIMNDCTRLKETVQTDRKQVNDLKYTIMQINRQISNKITVEEAHTIISQFESKMYQKIQNQKLQLQKLEFSLKKQLQEEILKLKKQSFRDLDLQSIKKQFPLLKKTSQKLQKKLDKYKEETKSLSKAVKSLEISGKIIDQETRENKKDFESYSKYNTTKNEDLGLILQEINQKLAYFDKVDNLEQKINCLNSQAAKAQWSTQCRTKNECIVWQKEIYNSFPEVFKFQSQKSQIMINESGTYLVQFILFECKTSLLAGSIWVQNISLEANKREFKATGNNSLKFITDIHQRSTVSLKLLGGQNSGSVGSRGVIKISKF